MLVITKNILCKKGEDSKSFSLLQLSAEMASKSAGNETGMILCVLSIYILFSLQKLHIEGSTEFFCESRRCRKKKKKKNPLRQS